MRPQFTYILASSAALLLAAVVVLTLLPRLQSPPQVQSTGKALVGGPFTMVDHTGKTVTQDDYKGRMMLMYFGFTYCPDVCPTRLLTLTKVLKLLENDLDKVQPIFVTIDPERDTVDTMAQYVDHFHPNFVGLTGTTEQVADMAGAYKVAFYKVRDEKLSSYLMDHTDIIYLMSGENEYLAHFSANSTAEEIAAGIKAQF
jgi:protein SCO1/2